MDNACALCRALQEDYRLVYKDALCFCIANIEPLNEGHFMVLPTRHVTALDDFSGEELKAIHELLHRIGNVIKKEYGHDVNIALNQGANTSQNHVHFHILPSPCAFRKTMATAHGLPERVRGTPVQLSTMRDRLLKHF